MATAPPNRALLLVLSVALGAALLLIAFLLGRESGRESGAAAQITADVQPLPRGEPDVEEPQTAGQARPWPEWADLEPWEDRETRPSQERVFAEPVPDRSAWPATRTTTGSSVDQSTGLTTSRSSADISAYLMTMDLIRSEQGAGDPNAFAMDLIKATMGGSSSGFDQLIADTEKMEREVRELSPPPACQDYHRANLDALAQGREMLEDMKNAIMRKDLDALNELARRAAALQTSAEALAQMREDLSARARR